MSIEERNSKSLKYTTTSNESVSRTDFIPTQTTKTLATESYQYFNQQPLSKNIITERSYNTFSQQSNSKNTSNRKTKQNLNSKFIGKKRVIQGYSLTSQGNPNYSSSKCTCDHSNESNQKSSLKCRFCGKNKANLSQKNAKDGDFCTCDFSI